MEVKSEENKKEKELNNWISKIIQSNPNKESLTVEKLKSFLPHRNLSDEEAEEMIFTIHNFCCLMYEYIIKQNQLKEPNGAIVEFNQENTKKQAA